MHLGSFYIIAKDFNKSVEFYEKILEMKVSKQNMDRFAMFEFEEHCISIMNGYFDTLHPDKVVNKGEYYSYFDDMNEIVQLPNSRKFVINFWTEDLRKEYNRIIKLNIVDNNDKVGLFTKIRYVCNVRPYYYFQLTDPDGNIIEINGKYVPDEGELD